MDLAQPFFEDRIGQYIKKGASVQPARSRTLYIAVHHAAATYPPGTALDSIFHSHSTRPDFGNYYRIGYHSVIQLNPGDVLRCYHVNPPHMQGAGVWGRNDVCYHICAATHFKANQPGPAWLEAIAQACVYALRLYPNASIKGHKELALGGHGTNCPGDAWAEWKPRLKSRIDELLRPDTGGAYLVRGLPIYQTPELTIPCGTLPSDTPVEIGKTYANGAGWLANGAGFVDMDGLGRAEK